MKKLNSIKLNLKGVRYGEKLYPARDWFVLLLMALLLLLASIAWNLWAFSKVTEGEAVGGGAPPADTDTAVIDSAVRIFEERQTEEARYRTEYRFVDPSR